MAILNALSFARIFIEQIFAFKLMAFTNHLYEIKSKYEQMCLNIPLNGFNNCYVGYNDN